MTQCWLGLPQKKHHCHDIFHSDFGVKQAINAFLHHLHQRNWRCFSYLLLFIIASIYQSPCLSEVTQSNLNVSVCLRSLSSYILLLLINNLFYRRQIFSILDHSPLTIQRRKKPAFFQNQYTTEVVVMMMMILTLVITNGKMCLWQLATPRKETGKRDKCTRQRWRQRLNGVKKEKWTKVPEKITRLSNTNHSYCLLTVL